MTDLRQAAKAVLDAWDSPLWKTGTTAAKIADLRTALARDHAMHDLARLGQEIEQEPVAWDNCRSEKQCSSWCGNSACASHWENIIPPQQQAEPECWCHKCNENKVVNNIPFGMTRMIVCPTCGNKRCPKASDHRLDCTGSNKTGQPGSVYSAPPQQQAEPVAWDKPSASFNEWWDSYRHNPANPFAEGSAAYWAWAGWKSAQRQWVGLTDEDVNRESAQITSQMKLAFHAGMYVAQKILKDKNNG